MSFGQPLGLSNRRCPVKLNLKYRQYILGTAKRWENKRNPKDPGFASRPLHPFKKVCPKYSVSKRPRPKKYPDTSFAEIGGTVSVSRSSRIELDRVSGKILNQGWASWSSRLPPWYIGTYLNSYSSCSLLKNIYCHSLKGKWPHYIIGDSQFEK